MLRILLAACLALMPVTQVSAAADVTEFTLDNGLQAVVIEDHRAPVVVHMLWYRVGAADEAGLAMVFTGMRHFRH